MTADPTMSVYQSNPFPTTFKGLLTTPDMRIFLVKVAKYVRKKVAGRKYVESN